VVRALQVLRHEGPPDALEQVEHYLTASGINAHEVVRRQNQHQAVNQVSVGNCVTSLRLLDALDWDKLFERTNLVEPVLREDPAGVYARQDFATRDRYRQAVERLARRSRFTEAGVARRAVERARCAPGPPLDHVGAYLVGPAQKALRADVGYRPRPGQRLLDAVFDHPHAV
jgi:cyclic beta-1,2-glucan synthetase